jgi:hypothetical protein
MIYAFRLTQRCFMIFLKALISIVLVVTFSNVKAYNMNNSAEVLDSYRCAKDNPSM